MAQTSINIGAVANDGSGDGIRVAGVGINANFTELFAKPSVLSHISFEGNNIKSTLSNADISLSGNGSFFFIDRFKDSLTGINSKNVLSGLCAIRFTSFHRGLSEILISGKFNLKSIY